MAEHTKGRVVAFRSVVESGTLILTEDGRGGCVAIVDSANDARRLAAAWNACEGISTGALEEGVVADLLAACEFAVTYDNSGVRAFVPPRGGLYTDLILRARAATSRAKGEQT